MFGKVLFLICIADAIALSSMKLEPKRSKRKSLSSPDLAESRQKKTLTRTGSWDEMVEEKRKQNQSSFGSASFRNSIMDRLHSKANEKTKAMKTQITRNQLFTIQISFQHSTHVYFFKISLKNVCYKCVCNSYE